MFDDMEKRELEALFDKFFLEYYEKQKQFREEGKDIKPGDIKAGSPEWKERTKRDIKIVQLGGVLSDIAERLREIQKEKT